MWQVADSPILAEHWEPPPAPETASPHRADEVQQLLDQLVVMTRTMQQVRSAS